MGHPMSPVKPTPIDSERVGGLPVCKTLHMLQAERQEQDETDITATADLLLRHWIQR